MDYGLSLIYANTQTSMREGRVLISGGILCATMDQVNCLVKQYACTEVCSVRVGEVCSDTGRPSK